MAGGLAELDAGFPSNTGTVERRVQAVYDYLVLLLENLRYILRNLGPENMNEAEILPWLNDKLEVKTLVSNTVITNELYADYGAIADLTVDELRTDYQKAARYLAGDTAALDYLYIHDEQIEFRSGTVHLDGGIPATEQLHRRGRTARIRAAGGLPRLERRRPPPLRLHRPHRRRLRSRLLRRAHGRQKARRRRKLALHAQRQIHPAARSARPGLVAGRTADAALGGGVEQ